MKRLDQAVDRAGIVDREVANADQRQTLFIKPFRRRTNPRSVSLVGRLKGKPSRPRARRR